MVVTAIIFILLTFFSEVPVFKRIINTREDPSTTSAKEKMTSIEQAKEELEKQGYTCTIK